MREILNMFSLQGKKAVITGGAGGLGSAIARGLGEAGAEIALCDIADTSSLVRQWKRQGIKVKGYWMDVMSREKTKACHDEIIQNMGSVDILVNAAGGGAKEATTSPELSFFDLPLSGLQKVIGLNLFGGAILPSQVFGKSMIDNEKGGSIINISSMSAIRPLTRVPSYSASKAAVSNFTQWLAVHFATEHSKKLRVNAIAPGFFLTPLNRHLLMDEGDNLSSRGKAVINHTPMGRFGRPDDLVGTCIWLASDAARFVTGTVIPVDGGFSAFSGV